MVYGVIPYPSKASSFHGMDPERMRYRGSNFLNHLVGWDFGQVRMVALNRDLSGAS